MLNLVSIQIQSAAVIMGQIQQLRAVGTYDDSSSQDITAQVVWTKVSDSSGADNLATLSSSGTLVSPNASSSLNGGNVFVTAALGAVTSSQTIPITALAVTNLSFASDSLTFAFNQTLPQVSLQATFNDGSSAVINGNSLFPITWSSANPALLSFIDTRGTLYFAGSGSTVILASINGVFTSTTVNVTSTVLSIYVTGSFKTYIGQTSQLSIFAQYSDGSIGDITGQITDPFTLSQTTFVSISQAGLVTGLASGTTTIGLTYAGVSSSFAFVVPAIVSTAITAPASVVAGKTAQFTMSQTYSDGSVVDVTPLAVWFSSAASIGTIATGGVLTGLSAGLISVGGFLSSQQIQSVPYTVLPSALVSINITASSTSVNTGATLQLKATGVYTTGIQTDITSQVQWKAANPTSTVNSTGLVTGQIVGLAVLTATSQGVQGALTINVLPAPNPNLLPQFLSHLTQTMQNYFDPKDVRPREGKYVLDAQLLNVAAQALELSDARFDRELKSTLLVDCPANIDNRGVYFQQGLQPGFDFTATHIVQTSNGSSLTTLAPYNDTLPVPNEITVDSRFAPVPMADPNLFTLTGQGVASLQSWSAQRTSNLTPPMIGRINFWLAGEGFNQIKVVVRITGQLAPLPAWANKQSETSETLTITQFGVSRSKFAWATISQVMALNLPAGVTLTGQVGNFTLPAVLDISRPYTSAIARGIKFNRYWSYTDGLLMEQYLASNYQGFRYIQSYASAPINGVAVEPNTYGLFVAQGTTLLYLDRREPLPSNLNAPAISTEPYYGIDVSVDETQLGFLRYVLLRPIAYANSAQVSQYRYLLQTPAGTTYALTPDGVLATYSSTAGWRRGAPISLTIPLAQTGTYVITLQCTGSGNTILSDSFPYPNFALAPKAKFDLSSILPTIKGLSFDDRGRLWVWTGTYAIPLEITYNAYVLDASSQSIYLTDSVQGLVIDGVTV
jgi:hypothetical protein